MPSKEVTLKFYELAVSQYLARVRQRDVVLLFYVAASGTAAGFSFDKEANLGLLILVPFLAGATGVIMAYQSFFVESISEYSYKEILPKLEGEAVPFLLSDSFATLGMRSVLLRTAGNFIILTGPAVSATVALRGGAHLSDSIVIAAGLFGLLGAFFLLFADVLHVRRVRRRSHERMVAIATQRQVMATEESKSA